MLTLAAIVVLIGWVVRSIGRRRARVRALERVGRLALPPPGGRSADAVIRDLLRAPPVPRSLPSDGVKAST